LQTCVSKGKVTQRELSLVLGAETPEDQRREALLAIAKHASEASADPENSLPPMPTGKTAVIRALWRMVLDGHKDAVTAARAICELMPACADLERELEPDASAPAPRKRVRNAIPLASDDDGENDEPMPAPTPAPYRGPRIIGDDDEPSPDPE
jgi:hypothetical protein